ncbi:hypothetical protein A33Q_3687 [Indibacter alkaliphilus LW1]|jgi:hypothetical protein|uniref:Lipoprotein n=1 Tax=Indibacter alkaliphilus (strain CCUG 57479 / KCTC 22604 / LW1) TaxID=1189612 RepID=S2DP46_INDAL|nr:hypothetical protein [Indibacter alkaliphilus]EOZ93741.1 hypothetical protein A33Q_3687 [Indibacter alkaliphilus LW1]
MKRTLVFALLCLVYLVSCSEKEAEEPVIIKDYDLFVKVKIDGVDYEYGYNLKEDYRTSESSPVLEEFIPGKGRNIILFHDEAIDIDIQQGCDKTSGKGACVFMVFRGLSSIGRNGDPYFGGSIPGNHVKLFERNYSYYNEEPLPFEVTLRNHDPIKFTVEGTFKGKAILRVITDKAEVKTIDIEGSFRSGALKN